jgi:hypothetical protein
MTNYGCKIRNETEFSTNPITFKNAIDLSNYQNEYLKIRDFKDDNFPILSGFRGYDNILLLGGGFEKKTDRWGLSGPGGTKEYDSLFIYDINQNKILKIIKYDEQDGFTMVFPVGINKDWIVYEEDDGNEFDPNFRFYVVNRNTNETKMVLERKKGSDKFFTKGENVPSRSGYAITFPHFFLHGDKLYMEILLSGSEVDMSVPFPTLPVISDSIYEIDLKENNIKRIFHSLERYAEISDLYVNDHYIAFSMTGRDFKKMTTYSDIYLYSFKSKKVSKFTDSGVSETPVLTPDDWIIYQVWQPSELSLNGLTRPPYATGCFYNVIRPIDKKEPVFKVTVGQDKKDTYLYPYFCGMSPSGRFILFQSPLRILDRKTNTITTLKGLPVGRLYQFPSDDTLVMIGDPNIPPEQLGTEIHLWQWLYIVDFNKLLQMVGNE